ncbi:MAG: hypothetical protein OEY36_03440 [Gammaproteobacteria bacterium]|nr:hypothetical protein [Gammaproteobacteria bacterium]
MLALNAMLTSRKAGIDAAGYARVTTELRAFSERLESSMAQLLVMSAEMTSLVSDDVKRGRITRIFNQALLDAAQRHGNHGGLSAAADASSQYSGNRFDSIARSIERLAKLSRQGQNVAVLAKVESMHIDKDSTVLHSIGDQVGEFVAQVEEAMAVAYKYASNTEVA